MAPKNESESYEQGRYGPSPGGNDKIDMGAFNTGRTQADLDKWVEQERKKSEEKEKSSS